MEDKARSRAGDKRGAWLGLDCEQKVTRDAVARFAEDPKGLSGSHELLDHNKSTRIEIL